MGWRELPPFAAVVLVGGVVAASLAASAHHGPFPAKIVLAPHRDFTVVTHQSSRVVEQHFEAGDTVTIDFPDSVFTINDVPYMPQAQEPEKVYPVEYLRLHYGRVPMIHRLVGPDSMSAERWNSALRQWETAYRDVLLESQQVCRDLVHHGMPVIAAEDSALSWLGRSPLIEFAGRRSNDGRSVHGIAVHAAGVENEAAFGFPLEELPTARTASSRFTEHEAEVQLESLRQLLTGDPGLQVTVEYRFGQGTIKSSNFAPAPKEGKR